MSNPFADLGGEEVPSDFSDLGAEVISTSPVKTREAAESIRYSEDTVNSFQPVDQFQSYKANGQSLFQGQPDITDPDQLRQLRQYKAAQLARAAATGDPEAQTLQGIQDYIPNTLQAIGNPSEAPYKAFVDAMPGTPIAERLFQSPIQGALPRPEGNGAIAGAVRGAENLVEGLPSVGNLTLGLALPGAPSVLQKVASAYFGVTMGHDAIQKLGDVYAATNPADRAQALVEGLGGGALALGAISHVGGRPGEAVDRYPIQVDPDLGIVKTPAGTLKVTNGVAKPLTPVEAQSAAALKGPEAVAPTVTEAVTEPAKVAPALTRIEPDTFERESGETLEPNHVPYRDPTTLQVFQAPQDATPEQLQGIQEAAAQENAAAEARSRMEALDQSTDQARADAATRSNFTQDENGKLVPNPTGDQPASVSTTDAPLWQNPDRLEALKSDILGQHAKAQNGMLSIAGERVEPIPNQQVQRAVAAIDERISQLRQPKTFPIPEREPVAAAPEPETPPPAPPEAPVAVAPTEPEPDHLTSIKNAATDQEREARGLPPADPVVRRTFPQVLQDALDELSKRTNAGQDLVDELKAKPRAITDTEDALLLKRQIDVQNEHDQAVKDAVTAKSDAEKFDAQSRIQRTRDQLQDIYAADRNAGTETARGLNARKMAANQNFKLGKMLAETEAAKGSPLTQDEKDVVQAKSEAIKRSEEAATKAAAAAETKKAESAADEQIKADKKEAAAEKPSRKSRATKPAPAPGKVRTFLNESREAALRRIKERSKKLYSNPLAPIAHLTDETIIAASHIANGLADFGVWSKEMVKDLGEGIRPFLTELFDRGKKFVAAQDTLEGLESKMSARVNEGDGLDKLAPYIKRMGKELVRSGIDKRDALVNSLHDRVEKILPGISREEVRDAYSGYGDFRPLSKDEIEVKNRDLKGQLQQIAKLESMQRGEAPAKAGPERRTPSDEERRLQQQVEQAKKIGGYRVTDPETQLRTALQAHERQLSNQIKDVSTEIETGQRKTSNPSPTNDRIEGLKDILNRLRETRDAIFGKKGITDEQRLKMALDAADRMTKEYERQVEKEDFLRSKGKPALTSPELDAAKARRDAARAQRDEYQALDEDFQKQQNEKRQTAMQSQLAELDRRVREKDLASKAAPTKPEATPELQTLRDQIDAKSKELTKLQNEAKRMTPAERLANQNQRQIKAANDAIAELQRKLAAKDLSVSTRTPRVGSPELEALRTQRDDLAKQLQKMRNDAKPRKTPEEITLKSAKTRTLNQIADLKDKLAKGDFSKGPKRAPITPDAELTKSQAQLADLKRQFQEGNLKLEAKNRSFGQKALDLGAQWSKFSLLTSPTILAKLVGASVYRYASTLAEAAPGAILRRAFPAVAEKARYEGGALRPVQEARSLTKGIVQGVRDIPRILKTHEDSLGATYGENKPQLRNPWLDWAGSMHAAIKSPIKRVIWERSFERRMESYAKSGVDVTQPEVQMRVGKEALEDAQRAIFQQPNKVSSAVQAFIRTLEQPDKSTGKVSPGNRLLATGAKVLFPITKVPLNVVSEALEYATGLGTGGLKLASAFKNDIANLSEPEADQILRLLKKGSIGGAIMLAAYLRPQSIGGYFVPRQQNPPGQPKPGELQVGGTTIPSSLTHTPMMDAANLAATMRRTMDARLGGKNSTQTKGLIEGAGAAILGLADETPYVNEMFRMGDMREPGGVTKYLGDMAASRIVPGASRYAAAVQDTPNASSATLLHPQPTKRVPATFGQRIEEDIPYLREQVGQKPLKTKASNYGAPHRKAY